jgi:hypothetical protein
MLGRVTADAVGGLPLPGLRNAIDARRDPITHCGSPPSTATAAIASAAPRPAAGS